MNKKAFLDYLAENYNISGEAFRLIGNILDYVARQDATEDEQYVMLCDLLDGTIGLSDREIRQIAL